MKKYILSVSLALALLLLLTSAAYAGELSPALDMQTGQQAGDAELILADDDAVYDANNTYKLTLDANGGYYADNPNVTVLESGVIEGDYFFGHWYIPTNPEARMAFSGWYYDAACTELAVSRYDSFTPTDDLTLYAGWTDGWVVTFDAGNGHFGDDTTRRSYSVPKGSAIQNSPGPESAYTNMWFDYWALEDGTQVDVWSYVPEGDVTLYAQYVHFYRLTLDANGGYFDNDPNSTVVAYQVTEGDYFNGRWYTPTNPDPHMAFSGWYYDAACTELAVGRYDSFIPTADVTLYAGWTDGWIVTFDAGNGHFGDDTTRRSYSVPKGSAIQNSPGPESAYTNMWFDYWALEDGTQVDVWSYVPEGDVTLYAQYVHFYRLTLDANGGYFGNDLNRTVRETQVTEGNSFYSGMYMLTNPDPRMAFTGWYYDAACTELAVGRYDSFIPTADVTLYAGWTEGWIITFDANGGNFGSNVTTYSYTVPKGSTIGYNPWPESADPNMQFSYWALEDGTRVYTGSYIPEGDITLYAQYVRFNRLTLDANGGYFGNDPNRNVGETQVTEGNSFYGGDYAPTNPDPRMAFSGWYYDAACTELAVGRYDSFIPTADVTLYAGWTEGWIITFDAGNGHFGDDTTRRSYSVPKGSAIQNSPGPESAYTNMWFDYWALEDGTRVNTWEYIPEGDITLYAQYARFYRLTLDANGGYFDNDPNRTARETRVTEGYSFYGGDYAPTNPDPRMAFSGWYYDAACTELAVSRDDYFTPTADITLYAGWTDGWIVTFDANGGNYGSNVTTYSYTVPKGSTIGYNPWPESADPNMQFSYWALEDGTRVYTGSYIPEGDITLYAQYVRFYRLTLDANGGYFDNNSNRTARETRVTEGNSFYGGNYMPTNPEARMAFSGWYYDAACTELAVGRYDSFIPTADVTLYAGWTEGWIVTFDANGGNFGSNVTTYSYVVPKGSTISGSFAPNAAEPEHMRFSYWTLEDGTRVYTGSYIPEGDVTLYAQYVRFYRLTLDANGGYFDNDPNRTARETRVTEGYSFYGGDYAPTNPDPRMAFSGWYYDTACTELAVGRYDSFIPTADVTLYAGWTEGWIVTFDANGGTFYDSSTTYSQTVLKGSEVQFYYPVPSLDDPNMEFSHWELEDGTRVDVWGYVPESDVTLYAQYVRLYEVTLDGNGGYFYNDPAVQTVSLRASESSAYWITPTNPDPRFTFDGWYYDPACTRLAAGRDKSMRVNRDMTLYAGWIEGWIVTFDAGNGHFGDDTETYTVTVLKGEPLKQYPYPYAQSRESYIWFDYYTLEDGTRVEECTSRGWGYSDYSQTFVPEGDVTLYAHYSHFYEVTFDANGGYFDNDPDRLTMNIRIAESSASDANWYSPTNPEPGKVFSGWYYDAACTRLAAAHDDTFTPHRDMTLYAGWNQGFIVSYDANGGEGAPAAQTKRSGEALVLSWEAPRMEGCYFLGWAESPDADRAAYLPGESFTGEADTTLYALWGNPDFVLPGSLTEIGEEAFAGAAFRFVKLPDSTASVGPRAFAGCGELDYIVIPDYLNQVDFSAFEGTQDVIVLTFSRFGRLYRLADYMRMMAP